MVSMTLHIVCGFTQHRRLAMAVNLALPTKHVKVGRPWARYCCLDGTDSSAHTLWPVYFCSLPCVGDYLPARTTCDIAMVPHSLASARIWKEGSSQDTVQGLNSVSIDSLEYGLTCVSLPLHHQGAEEATGGRWKELVRDTTVHPSAMSGQPGGKCDGGRSAVRSMIAPSWLGKREHSRHRP